MVAYLRGSDLTMALAYCQAVDVAGGCVGATTVLPIAVPSFSARDIRPTVSGIRDTPSLSARRDERGAPIPAPAGAAGAAGRPAEKPAGNWRK